VCCPTACVPCVLLSGGAEGAQAASQGGAEAAGSGGGGACPWKGFQSGTLFRGTVAIPTAAAVPRVLGHAPLTGGVETPFTWTRRRHGQHSLSANSNRQQPSSRRRLRRRRPAELARWRRRLRHTRRRRRRRGRKEEVGAGRTSGRRHTGSTAAAAAAVATARRRLPPLLPLLLRLLLLRRRRGVIRRRLVTVLTTAMLPPRTVVATPTAGKGKEAAALPQTGRRRVGTKAAPKEGLCPSRPLAPRHWRVVLLQHVARTGRQQQQQQPGRRCRWRRVSETRPRGRSCCSLRAAQAAAARCRRLWASRRCVLPPV
jgi:hypothetical protein